MGKDKQSRGNPAFLCLLQSFLIWLLQLLHLLHFPALWPAFGIVPVKYKEILIL